MLQAQAWLLLQVRRVSATAPSCLQQQQHRGASMACPVQGSRLVLQQAAMCLVMHPQLQHQGSWLGHQEGLA
jgi:hypothetical protein